MRAKTMSIVCGLLLTILACSKEEAPKVAPPPPKVTVIVTETQAVPIYQEFVGQIFGLNDIDIQARV
ncbi:MAG: hypothetical protein ACWGNK_04295, partial [Desulfobacterales bacterium]